MQCGDRYGDRLRSVWLKRLQDVKSTARRFVCSLTITQSRKNARFLTNFRKSLLRSRKIPGATTKRKRREKLISSAYPSAARRSFDRVVRRGHQRRERVQRRDGQLDIGCAVVGVEHSIYSSKRGTFAE